MRDVKYEPVFGDQTLFNGMMGDCEFASEEYGYMFANGILYYCERYNEKAGWSLSCKSHLTFKPLAMRRIIAEPKRWTVEDQKAGKLPEVGCEVINTDHSISVYVLCKVIYVDGEVVIVYNGELSQTYSHKAFLVAFKPIESPEEKAERLREEWCANAAKQLKNLEYSSTLTSIYDALLSGELKMPEVQK